MSLKKSLSLLVIFIFSFVISLAIISNNAKADPETVMDEDGSASISPQQAVGVEDPGLHVARAVAFPCWWRRIFFLLRLLPGILVSLFDRSERLVKL